MNLLAASFWQRLEEWDKYFFTKVNSDWSNGLFDAVMPVLRTPENWAPLYLFLVVFALLNFRLKGLWWVIFFLTTVAIADMTGNYVFKHNFERLRPCNDPGLSGSVRLLLKHCGAGFSFVSNHAANHFAMAVFFFISFRKIAGNWVWAGLLWAAAISYAQVYVGVHYPLDVLGGGLLGTIIGLTTATIFNKRFNFVIFDNQPTYP